MTHPRDRLLEWLRDAHAMEEQAEQVLSGQIRRIENYPALKKRLEQHLDETRRQAKDLEGCIKAMGSSTSLVKDTAGRMVGLGQALSGLFVGDEVVKGALASYTFEHMEVASYRILIAAAGEAQETEVKRICEKILAEEEKMAEWLEGHLAEVTRDHLRREAAEEATARR